MLDGRGDVRREGDQRGQVALWPCVRAAVDSTRWPTTLSAADRGTPSAAPSRCRAAAQTSGSFERSSTSTMSSPVIACRRSSRTSTAPAVAPGRAQVAPAVFSRRRTTATSAPSACPASATTPVRTSSSEIALLICRAMSRTCRFPPEARVGAEVDLRFADLFLGLGASRFPLAGMPDRVRSSDFDIGIAGALNQVGHSSINQVGQSSINQVGHSVARSSSDRDPHAEADGQGHEDHRAVRVPRAVLGDRAQEHPEQRRVP